MLLVAVVSVLGSAIAYSIVSGGLSAHDEPSRAEEVLARAMRRWATPERCVTEPIPCSRRRRSSIKRWALRRPLRDLPRQRRKRRHGDRSRPVPRVPDMRATNTQSLTDGELFSIIEHGRLTGMPAWGNGTPEGERDSWGLVHFVRRLPKLTPEEIERMESLNPEDPAQFKEEEGTALLARGSRSARYRRRRRRSHQD